MNDPFADLSVLETYVWDRLARGAVRSDDPFRLTVLATMGSGGPEARMLALRSADREAGCVECHSDLRTGKVRSLRADPRASLLFWDEDAKVQVRLSADIHLVAADPLRWSSVPSGARLNYGTDPAPGTPVDQPHSVTRSPDIARFVALTARVRSIDVLSLAHDPHRRARFDGTGATWVAP